MTITINGTTGISGVDGTASTPAIQGNDTNTGMFFPAADTIAFAEGGAEVARFDSSGNLGIGTTSPSGRLSTAVSDGVTNALYAERTGGAPVQFSMTFANQYANLISSNVLSLHAGSAERGRFDTSGNFLFNSGYGSVATAYGCRAWVNFNGTGTVAIRASGNVSSITDNGTGDYTVNFTTAMPDTNYSITAMGSNGGGDGLVPWVANAQTSPTTSAIRIRYGSTNFTLTDANFQSVAVFR